MKSSSQPPQTVTKQADKLIRDYAVRSSLIGFIPVPFADTLSLIGVQRLMLYKLSKMYGVPFKKNLAKISLSTLSSGITVRAASPLVSSALKVIPGAGTMAGTASAVALNSALTYAVGKVFQQHFENGGTLQDFDPEKAKEHFHHEFQKETRNETK